MNVGRSGAAVAEHMGYIYVAGGYDSERQDFRFKNDVEVFDSLNDEWSTLTSMNDTRICFSFFTLKNYFYAMGSTSSIERYDPWNARWTKVF